MEGLEYILIGLCLLFLATQLFHKDGFQDRAGSNMPSAAMIAPAGSPVLAKDCDSGRVIMEQTTSSPAATKAIRDMDDYEYIAIENNENDREVSMALRDKLMSQRPMDWSGLPPSSTQFQAGLKESFQNASQTVPDDAKPYQGVNGGSMAPPDTDAAEMRERATLQTYVPKRLSKEITYDVRDADDLIRKIYDEKGLVPTVAHEKGTNVYEIVGVRRKDEKIVYEGDEAPASTGPVRPAGEAVIRVPSAAADMAASKDPYYDTTPGGSRTRMGKWDFQAWTPGLERMFAPSEPKKDWY
jgi:hypothetical protein